MAHAATGDGQMQMLRCLGRRLEYLSQDKEKTESQKVKKNELPITAKEQVGNRDKQGGKEDKRAWLTGKMQIFRESVSL
jgi:hypothetical protein